MAHNRFRKGSGVFTCTVCGKQTRDTSGGNGQVELCQSCYDRAGDENAVCDGLMSQEEFDKKWSVSSAK